MIFLNQRSKGHRGHFVVTFVNVCPGLMTSYMAGEMCLSLFVFKLLFVPFSFRVGSVLLLLNVTALTKDKNFPIVVKASVI